MVVGIVLLAFQRISRQTLFAASSLPTDTITCKCSGTVFWNFVNPSKGAAHRSVQMCARLRCHVTMEREASTHDTEVPPVGSQLTCTKIIAYIRTCVWC